MSDRARDEALAFAGLGSALRFLRREKAWSLIRLAEATTDEAGVRVSAANLSRYERGVSMPQLETLERILAALGVSLEELALVLRRSRGEPRRVAELLVAAGSTSELVLTDEHRGELLRRGSS